MKIKLILSIFLIGLGESIFAYPIEPTSLRTLVMEAQYIIYADVIDIYTKEIDWNSDEKKAILVINEIFKGKFKSDTIDLFFDAGMSCPTPARYEKGTSVLVFLDRQGQGYSTHASAYGARIVDSVEFEVYKNRIIEMQRILKIINRPKRNKKTIDWLITCAENPITRWDGMYELMAESYFMSYYDYEQETFIREYELDENQKSRLRDVIFETVEMSYAELSLIDLIVKKNDTELIDFLIKELKKAYIDGSMFTSILMYFVADYSNRDDLMKIILEYDEIDPKDEKRDEKEDELTKNLLKQFNNLDFKLPSR